MLKFISLTLLLLVICIHCQSNRQKLCTKAKNLGLTFYTPQELEPILSCCEKPIYTFPHDHRKVGDEAQQCVIKYSMSKAIPALSLYNGFNSCTNIDQLYDKLETPMFNQLSSVLDVGNATLMNCKQNNKKVGDAKINACMNQVYGKCLGIITKKFINKVCNALAKKMNAKEWNCVKQYAPKVADVSAYGCFNLVK